MCVRLHECIIILTYSVSPPLQAQLQKAKEQADEFHQSYQSLDAGLGSMEEIQENDESIHLEVEVIKQQQEAQKVRVAASSSNCFCASLYPFLSSTIQIFRSGCFSVGSNIKRKREFSDTHFEIGKPFD